MANAATPGPDAEQAALGLPGHHGPDLLVAAGHPHPAARGVLGVERGPPEVHVQQRGGQVLGQPDPVDGQRLGVGQPEPLQVHQRGGLLQPEPGGDHPVGPHVEGAHHAALHPPGGLDRA